MNKLLKVVEIAWIVIAAICLFQVISEWGSGKDTQYIFAGFGVFAVVMFYIRRKQRIRYEQNKARKEQNQ
jgi:hypothetical protein